MAIGAVTIIRGGHDLVGNHRVVVADVIPTDGASYTAGGDTVTPASLGLDSIEVAIANVRTADTTVGPGNVCPIVQDDGSVKLLCQVAAKNADNADSADLSTALVRLTAWGI